MAMAIPSPTGIRSALLAGIAATVMPAASVDPRLRVLGESDGLPPLGNITVFIHRGVLTEAVALDVLVAQLRIAM